jgi:hypothetical protein
MQSVTHDEGGQRGPKVGVWGSCRVLHHLVVLVAMALVELSGCWAETSVPTMAFDVNVARPLQRPAARHSFGSLVLDAAKDTFYDIQSRRAEAQKCGLMMYWWQ